MLDKELVSIKEFKGLNLLGADEELTLRVSGNDQYDYIPFDYFRSVANLVPIKSGGVRTRYGFERYLEPTFTIGAGESIIMYWKISELQGVNYDDRYLILTFGAGVGKIYDTGVVGPATNPILTVTGMAYAFVINAFGRVYISPWESWATPLSNTTTGVVYVYNGLYNARVAGSDAPVPGAFAVAATAGGNCTAGLHFASVLFESDSGFISICPTAHLSAPISATTTTANATLSFTNTPLGPTGTVKRHIIITRTVVNNNGQGLQGYEPFFGVTINDNTTTAVTFNKPDTALIDSAKDYLTTPTNDTRIRAYVSLATYGNRMVYMNSRGATGFVGLKNHIAISPPNRPEQVGNAIVAQGQDSPSALLVGPNFSGNVMIGAELDKVFYVFKEDSSFSITEDPADDPSTWPVTLIDSGRGAFPLGVASVTDNPSGLLSGGLIVAGLHGISYFNGRFIDPPLTENIWDQILGGSGITTYYLKWLRLTIDPVRKWIFFEIFDLNLDITNEKIYIIDYNNGLSSDNVKLIKNFGAIKSFSTFSPQFKNLILRPPGTYGTVGVGFGLIYDAKHPLITAIYKDTGTNRIRIVSEALSAADGLKTNAASSVAIAWSFTTGYTPNVSGEQYQFSALRLRALVYYLGTLFDPGSQNITASFNVLDSSGVAGNIGVFTNPTYAPAKFITHNMNAKNEQISISLSGQSRVEIHQLALFGSRVAEDRPR